MENQLEMPKQERKEGRRPWRRQIVIACAVLLVAVALALNFTLFGGNANTTDPGDAPAGDAAGNNDAQTNTSLDGYFSATQVSRQRARDEALEVLQSVVDSAEADEATKTGALLEISELAKEMEAEANIEAMVLAKGFEQCVAILNGETCSVVVNGGELQQNQISQINEIVYEQAGILPTNIRIITK
ncbi:MAG: SpoIIIAH-like family protein [Clostridia bacterium]|nr:SpoIIIAH-like family protein [Clostridia bacterium]